MWRWWKKRDAPSCREVVAMVTDYLDDALSPRDRRRFEKHLEACTSCPEYVEQIRAIVRASRRSDPVGPPAPDEDDVKELFRRMRSDRGRFPG